MQKNGPAFTDFEDGAMRQRMHVGKSQRNGFVPRSSKRNSVLRALGFQPHKTCVWLPMSRNVRESICVKATMFVATCCKRNRKQKLF